MQYGQPGRSQWIFINALSLQVLMKKIFSLIALACLFMIAGAFALKKGPKPKQKITQGDVYFAAEDYKAALPLYLEAYQLDPSNSNTAFKIGVCYMNIPGQRRLAYPYLAAASHNVSEKYKAGSAKEKHAPVDTWYYFGQSLHLRNSFDSAIISFNNYWQYIDSTDQRLKDEILLRKRWSENAIALVADPVQIQVQNLGPNINSEYPEYSPVISADQRMVIFTTRRPGNVGSKIDSRDQMYFEDIYYSVMNDSGEWSKARPLGQNINTPGHEATIGMSADGQQLLIYKDDQGDGNIYLSYQQGESWGTPAKLTENVNSKSWEPSATITPDGNTLYFSSNREGGMGGTDIYRSVRLPNGEWSKPMNVGAPINTKYDEDAPSILADGLTLYYASNGDKSMGGFDILTTTKNEDGSWSTPVNVGYPVNTSNDDIFFAPTPDNTHAYYSSANSENGLGEKDICLLTFPGKQENPLTVLSGQITSIYGGVPPGTVITVTDVESGELMGTYQPNSSTGKYVIILPPGRNYSITYEATDFLYQSDNINIHDSAAYQVINRPVELAPLSVGQKITVRNIFFASGQSELQPESKAELDKLVKLMNTFPKLILEIAGHTDAAGSDELNQRLSEQRAQSVANYLIAHGIDKSRLRTIGMGEKYPIAQNYNKDGSPNRAGMSLNRRFEFTVLSVDGVLKDVVEPINVPDHLKQGK
jgi:outer membrane protein OmpA-like peptidoglycan-associated protein